jgi:hypothetical protein
VVRVFGVCPSLVSDDITHRRVSHLSRPSGLNNSVDEFPYGQIDREFALDLRVYVAHGTFA